MTIEIVASPKIAISPQFKGSLSEFKASRPYRGTDDEKFTKFSRFLAAISDIYNVPVPFLKIKERLDAFGRYIHHLRLIYLRKFSILTLLHEFRHHAWMSDGKIVRLSEDKEADAKTWSLSIFKYGWKTEYEKLVSSGDPDYQIPVARVVEISELE